METRREVLFHDLGSQCRPAAHISPVREKFKWNSVAFETEHIKGNMLVSLGKGTPQNVTLDPALTGWYRIFVAQPLCWSSGLRSDLLVRLSDEKAFTHFSHTAQATFARHRIQEAFWCCADMTGRSLVFGKPKHTKGMDAAVAWVRFVPMDETEVAAFLADQARTDTKRIYATNDMHGMLCMYGYQGIEDWRAVVQEYEQSDVEWLSMENIRIFDGEPASGDRDNFAYPRPVDDQAQHMIKDSFTLDMMRQLVEYGHERGLKMCSSIRMGGWGMEFPFDQMYFTNSFFANNRHLCCVDRDGTEIAAQSYCYTETQDYVIDRLVEMAEQGVDAVELMAHRGIPYILFEQPFVDRFTARYGEDPRPLPLDDERVMDLKCEIFAEFFRRLRARLDAATGKGTTRIHLRGLYCLYDSRYIGLDAEKLAAEGLIDAFISFPQRVREVLSDDVWQDESHTRIDLDKYYHYARTSTEPIIYRGSDLNSTPPMADSKGVPQGPEDQKARVAELMALEKKYGIPVYFDIMPRLLPAPDFRDRIVEMYDCGAERFSLWDTYSRAPHKINWSLMRQIGHRETLADYKGEGEYYSYYRVLRYADMDVSRYIPAWGG